MKRLSLISAVAALFLSGLTGQVFADDAVTVHYKLAVDQPTLFGSGDFDTFVGQVDDNTGTTDINVQCNPSSKGMVFGIGKTDEACTVVGQGTIKNPANLSQAAKRLEFTGKYVVDSKKNGYTDMTVLAGNYDQVGPAVGGPVAFGGSVIKVAGNPTESGKKLFADVMASIKDKMSSTKQVDDPNKTDSITFDNLVIPGVGTKDTTSSCTWGGPNIYPYVYEKWQLQYNVTCTDTAGTPFQLTGNMALVDAPAGSDHDQEYQINLVVPGAAGADPFAAVDPFATTNGITGILKMKNSGQKTEDSVYQTVNVSGDLVGHGLPPEVVRGFGEITLIFARTWFGA